MVDRGFDVVNYVLASSVALGGAKIFIDRYSPQAATPAVREVVLNLEHGNAHSQQRYVPPGKPIQYAMYTPPAGRSSVPLAQPVAHDFGNGVPAAPAPAAPYSTPAAEPPQQPAQQSSNPPPQQQQPQQGGGAGGPCDAPDMPKCITFEANNGNQPKPPTCPQDQALMGYTAEHFGSKPPEGAKHVFAYTHGFCGPTGNSGTAKSEAEWCGSVAGGCGLSYPSDDWHGPKGAECLIKWIVDNTPQKAHFEIDNCSEFKGGAVACYQALLSAMKSNPNLGGRRIAIKNVEVGEAEQMVSLFKGPESNLVSNFVLVEEKFNKAGIQSVFAGTCASVAQSQNTYQYGFNENHISAGGGTQGTTTAQTTP